MEIRLFDSRSAETTSRSSRAPTRRDVLAALSLAPWWPAVSAEDATSSWRPTKSVRLVVPFPPGGGADQLARIFAERLQPHLRQSVFVDNRGGANGIIGAQIASTAPPDGHTLFLGSIDTLSNNPGLHATLPYAPDAFVPLSALVTMPMVFAVSKQGRVRSLRDLVELGRSGDANYGHWGVGSVGHIVLEMFKQQAKLPQLQSIPYQGAGAATQALLGGQVDVLLSQWSLFQAQSDRLDAICLASKSRYAHGKDVPTMAELGYPLEADAWMGLFASPKTPLSIAHVLRSAAIDMMAQPEIQKLLIGLGLNPLQLPSPEAYAAFVTADRNRWMKTIRELGIKLSS